MTNTLAYYGKNHIKRTILFSKLVQLSSPYNNIVSNKQVPTLVEVLAYLTQK
jgi:hypothetical protein